MAYVERDYSSAERRNDESFTLFVTNFPEELNEDGISMIFEAFGEIRIFHPPNAKWAYVTYKTYREAEHAIRALNERGPLYLKVAFQKKKPKSKSPIYNSDPADLSQETLVNDFRYAETRIVPTDNCRRIAPRMLGAQLSRCVSYNPDSDANSVYPSELDHNIYNPFESVGRYAGTSAMWSRGSVNVDNYGKRHVSMGRGYTYHIPEPHPNLERQLGRVYEKRRAGLYEYGEDRLRSRVGKCLRCARMTSLICEECAGFYCSRECQVADWSRHKLECRPIPSLVEPVTLSRSSSDEKLHIPRKPGGMDLRGLGVLRRPKAAPKVPNSEPDSAPKVVNSEPDPFETTATNRNSAPPPPPPLTARIQTEAADETKVTPVVEAAKNSSTNFEYNEAMQRKSDNTTVPSNSRTGYSNHNQRYDENSNDRYKPNAGQQGNLQNAPRNGERGGGFRGKDQNRPFSGKGNYRSFNGANAGRRDSQNSGSQSEGMSDQAKNNLMKMDEELGFKHDTRAQPQTEEQPAIIPSTSRSETICEAQPIKPQPPPAIPSISRSETICEAQPMKPQPPLVIPSNTRSETICEAQPMKPQAPPAIPSTTRSETICAAQLIKPKISDSVFINVIVVFPMEDGTFWVHRQEDIQTITRMMQELHAKAPSYPAVSPRDVVVGETYGVLYCDLWHRAVLVSKNPTTIFYIDFGNEEPPQSEDFRLLADFPKYPPYAIRARLAAGSAVKTVEEGSKLSVKMIDVDERGIVKVVDEGSTTKVATAAPATAAVAPAIAETPTAEVAAPGASRVAEAPSVSAPTVTEATTAASEPRTEKKVTFKLPASIDSLEIKNEGFIQVYVALDNISYAVCVLNTAFTTEYSMVYEELSNICNAATVPANYSPQIGDFVCGKREDYWLRGYVLSLGPPIRLALVDEARVAPVTEVQPMPEGYEKICSFGAICSFDEPGSMFQADDAAQFAVTGVDTVAGGRVVRASLLTPESHKDRRVTLKNWSPTPEQKGIGFADLKSNSEVCITAYSNERVMFVRSLDPASLERNRRIDQDVAKWAQKAPKLNGPPTIGQLVIAKFTDGNFYRAIVTKIDGEKIAVSYVDYGNLDSATIDDLRVLSDELKQEKSCAAKIVLKDIVADVPPTQEVHQYLNLLVGKETPLFCTFDKIPSKDGVILTTATGECVNLKVNEFLTPAWKREDPAKDTKCFTMIDLEYAKLGEVGQETKALVLYASEAPFRYFMCPFDEDHIRHVSDLMPSLLEAYCASTKDHYIPRKAELCLAPYEGVWYRGVCLDPSETPTQARIHFIDYGNIDVIDHTNIRQTTKDFMAPPALACMCEVKNPGIKLVNGQIPEPIKARVDVLIPCNGLVDVKILQKVEDGEYVVEVPLLRQTLLAEGLL